MSAQIQKYQQLENLYELLIFQGFKNLAFYWNFNKPDGIIQNKEKLQELMKQDRIQNIYGVSEGLKEFSQTFSSEPITNFRYFVSTYLKYTIYEIFSGVKIILISQVTDSTDYYESLKDLYHKGYLEYIKRNIFYNHGDPLDCPYFLEKVQEIFEPYLKAIK